MSNEWDRLRNADKQIQKLLMTRVNGTADNPRKVSTIDLACEHAEAWAGITISNDSERGGSSNPRAIEEAQEIRRVHTLAIKAVDRIPDICKQLDTLASELYDTVQRLTSTVDPKKYPDPPGCKSCARTEEVNGVKIGGHFKKVYEKAKNSGLCRYCYDAKQATNALPPIKALDIYYTQGPRAAAVWLARNQAKKAS